MRSPGCTATVLRIWAVTCGIDPFMTSWRVKNRANIENRVNREIPELREKSNPFVFRSAMSGSFAFLTKFSDRMNKMRRMKRGILFSESVLNPVNPVHPVRLFLVAAGRAGLFCALQKRYKKTCLYRNLCHIPHVRALAL